jgi:hypothetical protein
MMLYKRKAKLMESFKVLIRSHCKIFKNISNKVLYFINLDYPHLNFKNSFEKMKQMATDLIKSVGKRLNPEKK